MTNAAVPCRKIGCHATATHAILMQVPLEFNAEKNSVIALLRKFKPLKIYGDLPLCAAHANKVNYRDILSEDLMRVITNIANEKRCLPQFKQTTITAVRLDDPGFLEHLHMKQQQETV